MLNRSDKHVNPVQTWVQELPWQNPDVIFEAWGDAPWCAFLESGGPVEARSRWQIFCTAPKHTFLVHNGVLVWGAGQQQCGTPQAVMAALRGLLPQITHGPHNTIPDLPFFGGLIGFFGYAFGAKLEGISCQTIATEPECAFGFYDHAFVWDRQEKRAFVTGFSGLGEGVEQSRARQKALCAAWHAVVQGSSMAAHALPHLAFTADQTQQAYCHAVAQAKEFIAAGDIFQVNITGRYTATLENSFSDKQLYRALRSHAPAPFGAYMRCGGHYALHSTSPERFLQLEPNGLVSSRPIKGTAPRGSTPAEDAILAEELGQNDKERAENLMIVDLMRNDIGRVAQVGSMSVPDFLTVERFAHVHHLVSQVQGVLDPTKDVFDLLQATLPPGSVTGAPKHRAMQIIDRLEASARGAYCGTIVRIGVEGRMDSSVIIRTIERCGQTLRIGAGGGVTILSDPQKEYDEMCLKIEPFLRLFGAQP